MSKSTLKKVVRSAAPLTGQSAQEIQAFGSVVAMPIALAEATRRGSAANLNQLLADTITLRDLYKKHHWQVSGPTFSRQSQIYLNGRTRCAGARRGEKEGGSSYP
jgi:starvation-inducible DNA-binding protein